MREKTTGGGSGGDGDYTPSQPAPAPKTSPAAAPYDPVAEARAAAAAKAQGGSGSPSTTSTSKPSSVVWVNRVPFAGANSAKNIDSAQGMWIDGRLSPADKRMWMSAYNAYSKVTGYKSKSKTSDGKGQALWKYAVTQGHAQGLTPSEWLSKVFAANGVTNKNGKNPADGLPDPTSNGSRSRGGSSGGGGGGGGAGGTSTSSQTQINLTDPYTARNLINQTLSQSLGRLATSAEMKQFTAALNAAERANPQTSFTSGSQDGAGNSTSSSVTGGGVDRNQVILDQVRTGAEYKAFNTDNVFRGAMDALAARIG